MMVGIAVSVKFITEGQMTLWNQILFRNIIAVVWALFIIRPRISLLSQLPRATLQTLSIRVACYIGAIYTFTVALDRTTVANVDFVGAFPFVAIIGWFIYSEAVKLLDLAVVAVAVAGLALISGVSLDTFEVGGGEAYAFISAGLFAFTWILSRNLSDTYSNEEYAAITQMLTTVPIFLVLLAVDGSSTLAEGISVADILWSLVAGFFIAANIILISAGAARVSGVELSVLTSLTSVLAVVASILFFADVPSFREIAGGVLVVGAALAFAFKDNAAPEQEPVAETS